MHDFLDKIAGVLRYSKIDSDLSLSGNDSSSSFDVFASTANSPVSVSVHSHPNSSPLGLVVKTANGKARAALHPAFEGDFVLRTVLSRPSVIEGTPRDPSGGDRERTVDVSGSRLGFTKGKVWWGDWDTANKGSVKILTSNAPVELDLTGE